MVTMWVVFWSTDHWQTQDRSRPYHSFDAALASAAACASDPRYSVTVEEWRGSEPGRTVRRAERRAA